MISMQNKAKGNSLPLGLGMALAQNLQAMEKFSALSQQEQQVTAHVSDIHSRGEMHSFVQQLAEGETAF